MRNYNNLYENRSLASKNIEMQDKLRLGTQKIWPVRRVDRLFPAIFAGSMEQSGYSLRPPSQYAHGLHTKTQMTQLKHIKHSLNEDGSAQP